MENSALQMDGLDSNGYAWSRIRTSDCYNPNATEHAEELTTKYRVPLTKVPTKI